MAVCWPSARTCNLLPRFCRGWALAQLLPGDVVEAGLWFTLSLEGPGSSFSLATAFRFLVARHSPLLFTVDGRPCGRRPATRRRSEKPWWYLHGRPQRGLYRVRGAPDVFGGLGFCIRWQRLQICGSGSCRKRVFSSLFEV